MHTKKEHFLILALAFLNLSGCGTTNASLPGASIAGTYSITGIKCNGTSATGTLAAMITAPSSSTITFTGTSYSESYTNGSCTITTTGTANTSGSQISTTCTGTYACTGTGCATYSASIIGTDVCTTPKNCSGSTTYNYSPSTGVASGGIATIAAVSSTTCTSAGQTDPISLTGTKQ